MLLNLMMKFQLPWARFEQRWKIPCLTSIRELQFVFPVRLCNLISTMQMKTKDLKPKSLDYSAQHFSSGVWLQPDKVLSRDVLILSLSSMIITFDIIHLYVRAEVNFGWLVRACRESVFGLWFQSWGRVGPVKLNRYRIEEEGRRVTKQPASHVCAFCVCFLFSQSTSNTLQAFTDKVKDLHWKIKHYTDEKCKR